MKEEEKTKHELKNHTQTSLADGKMVRKDDVRIEACGALDELGAHLGMICAMMKANGGTADSASQTFLNHVEGQLRQVQRYLFAIAAKVVGVDSPKNFPDEQAFLHLQEQIRDLRQEGACFQRFVLQGGTMISAALHQARTVVRRAERRTLAAGCEEAVPYLNLLSTYFYALALRHNALCGIDEIIL